MRCRHCGGRFSSRSPSCKGCGAPKTVARVNAEFNRRRPLAKATDFLVAECMRRQKRKREDMEADEAAADAWRFGSIMPLFLAGLVCLTFPALLLLLLPALVFIDWE